MSQNLPWMMMNDNNFIFPGLITHWDSFYWNGSGWIPEDRADITYNAELLKIMHYEEYYNGEVWYPETRRNYFYDDTNNLSYEIDQENNFDILVDSRRTDYTWEQYTANDEDLIPASGLSLKAYPSPFNDNITIQADSKELSPVVIGIYNLRGQLIRQYLSQPGQAVIWNGSDNSGNSSPAGIYFLKVDQGSGSVRSNWSRSSKIILSITNDLPCEGSFFIDQIWAVKRSQPGYLGKSAAQPPCLPICTANPAHRSPLC
jgi:hypothetical protein